MMDLAPIVLTALTVILQVILIIQVIDLKKKKKDDTIQERPAFSEQKDIRRERETDNRFARKPPHEQKIKPSPVQPQAFDHVERSLRDINLRLKNAEKDQEKERKRIKDTLSPSSPRRFDNHKTRDRNETFRRNDRPRQDFQQNRNAESRHGHREQKMPQKNVFEINESGPPSFEEKPTTTAKAEPIGTSVDIPIPFVEKTSTNSVENNPIPINEAKEQLQHGRKVLVKRRILTIEQTPSIDSGDAERKDTDANQNPSVSPQPSLLTARDTNPETKHAERAPDQIQGENESYAAGPISFGR